MSTGLPPVLESGRDAPRQLPYDVDIEQALLGAMLVDNFLLERVHPVLKPEHFYDPLHQRLYDAIERMWLKTHAVTPLTLKTMMQQDAGFAEVGGQAYLVSLAHAAPALPNVRDYARILADLAVRRELIRLGEDIVNTAFEAPIEVAPAAQIEMAAAALQSLSGHVDDGALPVFSAADLAGCPVPDREELVEGLLPRRVVAILSGDGATGKSTIALQLATACVLNSPWLGRYVFPHGPTLYISAEEDKSELHRRVAAILADAGARFEDVPNLHLVSLAAQDALLAVAVSADRLEPTPLFRRVEAQVRRIRPVLVVLDTLSDFFGGDEIKRSQARQFITMLRGVAVRYDTTILLLSHPSLAGMREGTGTSGSTGWNNSARARLYFERIKSSDGAEDDPNARLLTSKKANYGPTGMAIRLRWDRGVFKVQREGIEDAAAHAKADRVFLEMLANYCAQGRNVSAATGHSYAPAVFSKDKVAATVAKRDLEGAMNRLLAKGHVRVETVGPPSRQTKRLVVTNGGSS